ncbi:MAG: PaaI family thioesterase [Sinimarinibacterium flocculans]|uniref:PaaI family thioesterase n=1 Tax=Sinimarinibacterium flocculans TaxID=985250 RepID=UPI002EC1CC19|nr:PaaI family thioesterase [Pseudomonadota bacterium]
MSTPIGSMLAEARRRAREHADFDGFVALVPYARFLGLRVEAQDGQLRMRLPYRRELIGNPALPALHGGVTAAFMENAALLHLLLRLDEDRIPKSIDFAIDYLLSARPQDCFAECEVTRAGVRVVHTQIRCWQDVPERPIAVARAHFLLSYPE